MSEKVTQVMNFTGYSMWRIHKSIWVGFLLVVITLMPVLSRGPWKKSLIESGFKPAELLEESEEGPDFIVIYSMNDCMLCLFEVEQWNRIHHELSGLVQVRAFVTEDNQDHQSFLAENEVPFKVSQHDAFIESVRTYLNRFDLELRTPVKFLVDGDGTVLFHEFGEKDMTKQALLPERIKALLEK